MKTFKLVEDGGLIEKGLPASYLHSCEKIPAEIYENADDSSKAIADIICKAIKRNPKLRLGLSTGRTPLALFKELAARCAEGKVSFKGVEIYSIDEYYPFKPEAAQSRNRQLHDELVAKIDIRPENVYIPDGTVEHDKLNEYCEAFDEQARGLDMIVIGMGEKGQVGFNEAGSSPKSRTRSVRLSYNSRRRQAHNFNGSLGDTPQSAITMGISTILSAKKIILMAWGEDKSNAVAGVVEGPSDPICPASLLQAHDNIQIFVDTNAASLLTRVVAPWVVGPCEWTPKYIRKAVVWLCQKVGKPILKLTQQDYLDNSLAQLLDLATYDQINIKVFNDLQHTITGWPAGKPNADDSTRPSPALPYPKTVLIFSPHPDDDVISMGGTFIRMVEHGHNVHVAYETSGNVAVHDDVVFQHIDCERELGLGDRRDEVSKLIASKIPGEPEPRALLDLKAAIRRSEARAAVRSFGLNPDTNAHFLNLPFYETGGIKKGAVTERDLKIVMDLIEELKPNMIFLAGDLADPHGTHRVCTETALEAISRLSDEDWMKDGHVWLYRGAWMEWELGRVDMAVPLSPDEVIKKRHAIYRHLSQKDIMPFPGDDTREFWQRAEERTQNTAKLYDQLGMAEYQAIEVFVKLF